MQKEATLNLETVRLSPESARVDVMAENVPANLFGAAFHLQIRGCEWSLENFTKGDVFRGELSSPLIMAEERVTADGNKEIVFGMALKRTEILPARNGKLVSFNLKVEPGAVISAELNDLRLVTSNEAVDAGVSAVTEVQVNPARGLHADLFSPRALEDVYLVMGFFAGFSLFVFLIYLFVRRLFGQTRG